MSSARFGNIVLRWSLPAMTEMTRTGCYGWR
jgi:hypothetical protein